MHKFRILKTEKGEFRVQFVYNSEIMVWSENYASKASAKNLVESLKKNAPSAPVIDLTNEETGSGYRFEIDQAKNGETFLRFRAVNGEIMVRSETYKSKASAKNCAESIRRSVANAPLLDQAL
jgi:uncharacterized protein YegP (UPF0339 family)